MRDAPSDPYADERHARADGDVRDGDVRGDGVREDGARDGADAREPVDARAEAASIVALPPIDGEPDPDGADCVACGRCCHHPPRTVHLLEEDDARMGPRLLARWTELDLTPPGWRFVKNAGARCGALDVSVPGRFPCAIYEVRPTDCRIVEPGSPCCLEARRLGHLGTSVEFARRTG